MGAGSGINPTTGKLKTLDDHVEARRKRQGVDSLAEVAFGKKGNRQPTNADGVRREKVMRVRRRVERTRRKVLEREMDVVRRKRMIPRTSLRPVRESQPASDDN